MDRWGSAESAELGRKADERKHSCDTCGDLRLRQLIQRIFYPSELLPNMGTLHKIFSGVSLQATKMKANQDAPVKFISQDYRCVRNDGKIIRPKSSERLWLLAAAMKSLDL